MSTNKQHRTRNRRVSDLPESKQRRRLENLLHTRRQVSHLAAEYRSHGLEDHIDLYLLQLEIEQVLADDFPQAFQERIGDWADEEAASEHHPMVTAETCRLCQAIALHENGAGAPFAA